MKKLINPILFLCLLAITVTACKKDKSNKKVATTATVTAEHIGFDGDGGKAFKSTIATLVKAGPTLTITAVQGDSHNGITIVLANISATGTFTLDQGNADSNTAVITKDTTNPSDTDLAYTTDATSGGVIGGGQVKVTKLTATEVEGTFSIVAYNRSGKAGYVEQGEFSGQLNK